MCSRQCLMSKVCYIHCFFKIVIAYNTYIKFQYLVVPCKIILMNQTPFYNQKNIFKTIIIMQ